MGRGFPAYVIMVSAVYSIVYPNPPALVTFLIVYHVAVVQLQAMWLSGSQVKSSDGCDSFLLIAPARVVRLQLLELLELLAEPQKRKSYKFFTTYLRHYGHLAVSSNRIAQVVKAQTSAPFDNRMHREKLWIGFKWKYVLKTTISSLN